jgi:hypothetical protein
MNPDHYLVLPRTSSTSSSSEHEFSRAAGSSSSPPRGRVIDESFRRMAAKQDQQALIRLIGLIFFPLAAAGDVADWDS